MGDPHMLLVGFWVSVGRSCTKIEIWSMFAQICCKELLGSDGCSGVD